MRHISWGKTGICDYFVLPVIKYSVNYSISHKCADNSRYSEGGNSAIGAADGFEKNGITPVKVMAGSAPLMIRSTSVLSIIQSLLAAASDPLSFDPFRSLYMALVGVAFSDTRYVMSS